MAFTVNKRFVSWNLPKLSQLWLCNGGFGSCTTQNHLQTKQFVNGAWIPAEWLPVRCETNRPSGPMDPDGLFVSQRTGSHSAGIHVPFMNCFVCRSFCVVHDPKPPLRSHNWLSFGKFQDRTLSYSLWTLFFGSHDHPLSVEPGSTPRHLVQKRTWRDSLPIDMLLSAVSVLVVAQSSSEIPEGLMNIPVCYPGVLHGSVRRTWKWWTRRRRRDVAMPGAGAGNCPFSAPLWIGKQDIGHKLRTLKRNTVSVTSKCLAVTWIQAAPH